MIDEWMDGGEGMVNGTGWMMEGWRGQMIDGWMDDGWMNIEVAMNVLNTKNQRNLCLSKDHHNCKKTEGLL